MWRYVVRRLLWVVVVVLIITALTFLIFFVMPPTDPATTFAGKQPTPELIAEIKHQFGLDKPVYQQYLLWLKNLVLGDEYGWPGLGFSYVTRTPVRSLLLDPLPLTNQPAGGAAPLRRGLGLPPLLARLPIPIQLAVGAALIWLCIGIPIGVISAVKKRSAVDRLSMGAALFFVSAAGFWLGLG